MNFSAKNGCPLSEKCFLTGPYFAKCCWNLGMVVSAVFFGISKKKVYLLKYHICFLIECEEVSSNFFPGSIGDISCLHR